MFYDINLVIFFYAMVSVVFFFFFGALGASFALVLRNKEVRSDDFLMFIFQALGWRLQIEVAFLFRGFLKKRKD